MKSYEELIKIKNFGDRLNYLRCETISPRHISQMLYRKNPL